MRGREGTTPVRGAGNGGSQPPATGQNTNNNNNSRRNRRTNPAQALATYAIRLDRHLTAPQQQQQQQQQQQGQQNQQEDEHLESVVHHGVCCDSCEVMPIRGARYSAQIETTTICAPNVIVIRRDEARGAICDSID